MRTLGWLVGLLLLALVLVTASASAAPNCSQINFQTFCYQDDRCESCTIEYRGSCSNIPPDREWRCAWFDCSYPLDENEYGAWVPCNCPGQGGQGCDCLLAGTPITLADGTTKPVESIRVGDRILGFDESSKTMRPATVVAVHPPFQTDNYIVINGKLRMTEAHPVLSGGRWLAVADLQVGKWLTNSHGLGQPIVSIERISESATTYNFQVSGGTYVAGGIVVHNKDNCENFMQYPEP